MGLVSLLFSFRGRISRKQYWSGMGIVGLLSFIARILVSATSASSYFDAKPSGDVVGATLGAGAAGLPIYALIVWCSLAIQFKRFHDRGRTGWISLLPLTLGLLLLASLLGDVFNNAPIEKIVSDVLPYAALLMLTSIGFFIDLGCMGSVEGPNKYGPSPDAPRGPLEPARPSGAVDAASSLFGAQSAMDRAIAERNSLPQAQRKPAPAAAPSLAPAMRASAQPAPAGFGRRVAR